MGLLSSAATLLLKRRIKRILAAMQHPEDTQQEWFRHLVSKGAHTQYGKLHGLQKGMDYEQFRQNVPVRPYEELWPFIEQMMHGNRNVLWPGRVRNFSKSSGTTQGRSKFIPITQESLWDCHYKAGQDMISLYLHNRPQSQVLQGKNLAISGSIQKNEYQVRSKIGDVSALIISGLPAWAQYMRVPKLSVAVLPEWEEKLEKIAILASKEDVTSLSGVPTWMILLLKRVLEINGATNLKEVWPNLEVFLHGAVSFTPYKPLFDELMGPNKLEYMEIYNASEGFFGLKDDLSSPPGEMALLVDHGVFYEFIPADEHRRNSDKAIPLWEVQAGIEYAMVITTNGGLWRYLIGDTITFSSTNPYRFHISGRTKHFINTFGEEVVVDNAEAAIAYASKETGALISNYTVAPVYMDGRNQACHEWLIEFEREPANQEQFRLLLDQKLRDVNSDYDAKRYRDMALKLPEIRQVPSGTFYAWLQSRGKLGGQHKIPRLSNTREYVEEILSLQGISLEAAQTT